MLVEMSAQDDEKEPELVTWGESDYPLPRMDSFGANRLNYVLKQTYIRALNQQLFESDIFWRHLSDGHDKK